VACSRSKFKCCSSGTKRPRVASFNDYNDDNNKTGQTESLTGCSQGAEDIGSAQNQPPPPAAMTTEYRVSLSYPNPSLGQMVAGSQTSNSIDDEASRSKLGYGDSGQVKGLQQAALVLT
jgi:hypothetical protein